MKKIFLIFTLCLITFTLCVGCGNSESVNEISDLTGTWVSENVDGSWQEAVIADDSITIYWVSDNGSSKSLYWAGSYTAPTNPTVEYSWTSNNDTEQTSGSFLASSDDTKQFTYTNGVLSYEVSAFGTTKTLELVRQ